MRAKFERQLCGLDCANEALAVKFDSPDERAVKFEPVQKTGFAGLRSKNRVPYAVGTLGECRERLRFRSEVGLRSTEK